MANQEPNITPNNKPTGETAQQFAARVLSGFENMKQTAPNNATLVTHSSVLKAIKSWEDPKTWSSVQKPTDPNNFNPEQWKAYAKKFNTESTENGDVEKFVSKNGHVFVIRHGETEDNKQNKFRSGDTNLTPKGEQDAKDAAIKLGKQTKGQVPKIITSDLPRAIHTSNIIEQTIKSGAWKKGQNQQKIS